MSSEGRWLRRLRAAGWVAVVIAVFEQIPRFPQVWLIILAAGVWAILVASSALSDFGYTTPREPERGEDEDASAL